MIKKKGKFLTFVFSLFPGAAHMYMGFMKMGVSLMGLFFAVLMLSSWLYIGPLMYAMPVLWFYSFFDAINKAWLSDEEFYSLEDHYLFVNAGLAGDSMGFIQKHKLTIGIVILVFGIYLILNNSISLFAEFLPYSLSQLLKNTFRVLPQILIGALIIFVGIRLIIGKKHEGGDRQ